MPDCLVDASLVGAAVFGYYRIRGSARERERRKKFAVLSKVSQHVIQRDFNKDWPLTRNVDQKLPLGADSSAAAALRAVQEYQDARGPAEPRGPALPSCWLGFVYFGGCEDNAMKTDVETAVCEELKLWLLSAAMGAVSAEEASRRLQFYHELLMRPETFSEAAFLALIAVVCERLDELAERLAGAMRTCALQLNKVMNVGRDIVNGLLPLLVLALTDMLADGTLPLLCVDLLAVSASDELEGGGSGGILAGMWRKDAGRLLRELLCSPHLRQLWGLGDEEAVEGCGHLQGVTAMKVETYHAWEDALDEGDQLSESGLFEAFVRKDSWRVLSSYLNLFENLDKFVKFMSMIEPYKALANVAGDAAMYRLRGTLQHLLQEAEIALVQVETDANKVLGAAKHAVIEGALRDPNPPKQWIRWLERLQIIDEQAQGRSYRAFVAAVEELRFLTCDARLPELQAACTRSLGRISDILASQDFRARCSELPPEPPQLALAPVGAGLAAPPQSTILAIEVEPDWSVERQFWLGEEEMQGLGSHERARCVGSCPREGLGNLVESLNRGDIPDPGNFYVVRFEDAEEYIGLYRPGAREAAVDALGLNESRWRPPPLQAVVSVQDLDEAEEAPAKASPPAPATEAPPPLTEAPVPATQAPALADAEDVEAVAEELQAKFYEVLFAAVLPLFEQSEAITGSQALLLLRRTEPELAEDVLQRILKVKDRDHANGLVDCATLRRMGQLVAHAQAGRTDLENLRGVLPKQVPHFRGFLWVPQREKISVLEPF